MTVAAPLSKRIGLSTLSLRAARLRWISNKLASRLAGNWISVVLYRRCWSSLVEKFFALSAECERHSSNAIIPLPRDCAEELVSLAAVVPLIASDITASFSSQVFASDASMQSGAAVCTEVHQDLVSTLWLGSDKRGHYTKLDGVFRSCLRHLGEDEGADEDWSADPGQSPSPFRAPLLYFDFVEICGGAGVVSRSAASLGLVVAPTLDISESVHYDLKDLRLLEWIMHMIESSRFRSFLVEPPCTSFSAAAFPMVRSYRVPLGFCRTHPKTLEGNTLAFRAFVLLRHGRRHRTPCGLEQPRRSKMMWLLHWKRLLLLGFLEQVIASCQFGSPHKKEFVFLVYGIPTDGLEVKCPGGHEHIKIEGKYTRPSATYVEGLALHVARFFQRALMLKARIVDFAQLPGLESVLSNDVLLTSRWKLVDFVPWRTPLHINLLETSMAVRVLKRQAKLLPDTRFLNFLDSQVARGALTKGRSSSRLLLGFCRRAAALQIIGGLYPVWPFSPTRLNVADDPTRGLPPRPPVLHSLQGFDGLDLSQLHAVPLSRPMANWIRLVVLIAMLQPSDALDIGLSLSGFDPLNPYPCGFSLVGFLAFSSLLLACLFMALVFWVALAGWLVFALPRGTKVLGRAQLMLVAVLFVLCSPLHAMEPLNTAEAERASWRQGTNLIASRTVRPETRAGREKLLERFGTWLWMHHQVQLSVLLATKPADPEEICKWLVLFGQDCYASGKTYGSFSETINAVAAARPLIKRQLAPAWDLAFAWLCDEPHRHHPALPASVLLAMLSVALMWGWPFKAGILALTWNGILRIGETLMAQRKDLVLIKDSMPGINFILLRIKMPKTRGRSAKHQAARVDPIDMIQLITGVFEHLHPDAKLWPFSASTLRKRFNNLLEAVGLKGGDHGEVRGFDLASLRPGGATHLLLRTEDPELIRRRGRWLSSRVMEIYLQEVMATTYIQKLSPTVRAKILRLAAAFPHVLAQALSFLSCGIPAAVWPPLFQARASEELG